MAGWHHQLVGREFELTPGVSDGQDGLACCDSGGRKKSDTTERLNLTENEFFSQKIMKTFYMLVGMCQLKMLAWKGKSGRETNTRKTLQS